jgi:hypothetical protein
MLEAQGYEGNYMIARGLAWGGAAGGSLEGIN